MTLPTYFGLMRQRAGKARSRHLVASRVGDVDVKLILMPDGYCQWCGKALIGRARRFCRPTDGYSQSECVQGFYRVWYTIPRFKRAIYVRDNCTCQICGAKPTWTNKFGITIPDFDKLAIDHIQPFAKGGKTVLENLQVACQRCNSQKSDKLEFVPQRNLL